MYHIKKIKVKELKVLHHYHLWSENLNRISNKAEFVEDGTGFLERIGKVFY